MSTVSQNAERTALLSEQHHPFQSSDSASRSGELNHEEFRNPPQYRIVGEEEVDPPRALEDSDVHHRAVMRKLGRWQIFFITISGTIGLGLFSDTGKILSLAGPAGGLLALFIIGVVVVLVMQCVSEMINYWPISNALVEFVNAFVDEDLGPIIGFAYWCAYSVTFATLISAANDLAAYYSLPKVVQFLMFNIFIPCTLVLINWMGVEWFGRVETIFGILKILLVVGACVLMLIINVGGAHNPIIGLKYIQDGFRHDDAVVSSPARAILITIPIAAYAFSGVELVAVTALEAAEPRTSLRWPPTRFIAPLLMIIYIFATFLFYLDVSWTDHLLASIPKTTCTPSSVVMIAAMNARIPVLPGFLNGCLIMAILSSANTSLYVASRALYGLTRVLSPEDAWFRRSFYRLGTTNANGVPTCALLISALAFGLWLPLIHFLTEFKDQALQEMMSGIATVAVILVWASQCLAFIRFRKWIADHREYVQADFDNYFERSLPKGGVHLDSWYQSIQPLGAWIGLTFCLLTVVVFSSASWADRGESAATITAAWLGPGSLLLIWVAKKIWTQRSFVKFGEDQGNLRSQLIRLNTLVLTAQGASGTSSKESSRHPTFDPPDS